MTDSVMTDSAMSKRDYGAADENEAFVRQERDHRYRWAAFGLTLGVLLMPLGGLLDWTVYREQFVWLFSARILVTALLAIGLLTRARWSSGRWFEPVSFALILLPGLFICWMMYLTDAGQSQYYFGLILLMILLNLLGFRAGEATAFCLSLIAAYALAVFSGDGSETGVNTIQGLFFLFVSATASVSVCYTYRKSRFEAFCLNRDLAHEEELRRRSILRLRDTEQQLVHSEKMRAIAGVAAGLLHEINNPVNYSLMAVKVLKRQLPAESECLETVSDIESGVQRIGKIVSDLQGFAHPEQHSVQSAFRLREAIDQAIRFLTHELPEQRVRVDSASVDDVEVMGAQSQVIQVLLNLIHNAEKAIRATAPAAQEDPAGQRQYRIAPDKTIEIRVTSQDGRAFISIKDTGIGMASSDLEMVRQPFFTTHRGEGLGLGLGICEMIVHGHGGQIEISSEPGVGTTVTFDLPLAEPRHEPTIPDQGSPDRVERPAVSPSPSRVL